MGLNKRIPLSDFVSLQRGFDLTKKNMNQGHHPVLGSTSIIGYHDQYKVKAPGVVTGRSGSLGVVQYVEKNFWPHNTTLWVKDYKGNNPYFVYYTLKTLPLSDFNVGVGVPTLNRNHLDQIQVFSHSLDKQIKISSVLKSYDELIKNNNRRIQILEEIAQNLYEEWFVNFKFPGYEKVKMVDSELGKIPYDWQVIKLGKILSLNRGKNITKKKAIPKGIPVVGGGLKPSYYHNESNTKGPVLTISASGANAGYVNLYFRDIWASDCSYLSETETELFYFFYSYLKQKQDEIFSKQTGSAQPHIYPRNIYRLDIVCPKENLIKKYNDYAKELYSLIGNLKEKNVLLKQTRDLLLPRLISGETKV